MKFLMRGKILGRARIKTGATVSQDFHFCRWEDQGEIFDVHEFLETRHELVADGYGNLKKRGAYGNGSLFVNPKDLMWEPE